MKQEWSRDYQELSIKDKENPHSLVNLVPTYISQYIATLPDDILSMGEAELRQNAKFSDYEELLRISFWEEYRRATRVNQNMSMPNVYGGICSSNRFVTCCSNSFKLAFIVTPPKEVQVALENLLYIALNEMEKILKIPMVNEEGKTDTKLAMVKYKVFEDIMNRRRGVLVQRSEVTSKNLNVNVESKQETPKMDSLEAIEAEIKALEKKTLSLTASTAENIDLFSKPLEKEVVSLDEEQI